MPVLRHRRPGGLRRSGYERLIGVGGADHGIQIFHAFRLPPEFRFRDIRGMIWQSAANVKAEGRRGMSKELKRAIERRPYFSRGSCRKYWPGDNTGVRR